MVGCPFHLRTSIINSTGGCLFTFLVFNVNYCAYSALILAQIRHTVGYLVIPTRTALRSAKMSNNQLLQLHYTTDRPQPRARGCTVGTEAPLIITTHSYIPPHYQLSNQRGIITTHANNPCEYNGLVGSHKAMNTQLFPMDSEQL